MDLVRFHNRRNGGTEGGDCNALRIGGGRGMTGGDLEAVLERSEPCGFCLRAMQKLIYEGRDKITRKEYYGSIENKKRLP